MSRAMNFVILIYMNTTQSTHKEAHNMNIIFSSLTTRSDPGLEFNQQHDFLVIFQTGVMWIARR